EVGEELRAQVVADAVEAVDRQHLEEEVVHDLLDSAAAVEAAGDTVEQRRHRVRLLGEGPEPADQRQRLDERRTADIGGLTERLQRGGGGAAERTELEHEPAQARSGP